MAGKTNFDELRIFLPNNACSENAALLTQYLFIKDEKKKEEKKQLLIRKFNDEEFFKNMALSFSSINKDVEKIVRRFGYYDENSCAYHLPAILIAQLGRNFNEASNTISGSDLMAITLKYVKDILRRASGKTVFLECEKKQKLVDFYKSNGFIALDNEVLSKDSKELMQLYRLL